MDYDAVSLSDWLTIIAIVLAPLLAVQVQKWLEAFRERRTRKSWVFSTLMATRAARVSPNHTLALNMIDLEFYGHKIFGMRYQSSADKLVTTKWSEYLDQLNQQTGEGEAVTIWRTRCDDLFTELLYEMSLSLGYNFDKVHLRRGIYAPKAHSDQEVAQIAIRDNLARLLNREQTIRVSIENGGENPQNRH